MYLAVRGASLEKKLNRPINGRFLVTWPRAANGHAAAAPPKSVMNCRRRMGLPLLAETIRYQFSTDHGSGKRRA
jgi:hypothetical protein